MVAFKRYRLGIWVGLMVMVFFAAACGPAETVTPEPVERPTLPPLTEGMGAVTGVLLNQTGAIPEGTLFYLTNVTWHPDGWAVFYLDPATTRTTPVHSSGFFQVTDVIPGEYVFVIGASPENTVAINGEDNQPRVYEVKAGEVLDVGEYRISLIVPVELPTTEPPTGYPGEVVTTPAYP